jgi:hypothetical protein
MMSDPEVEQHLARCPACQAEVVAMRALSARLAQELNRYDCLTTEVIIGLAAEILPRAERLAAEAHVRHCARCAEEVSLTAEALAQPEPLLDWTAPTLSDHLVAGVRRLIATLVTATAPGAPDLALGVRLRGGAGSDAPQIYRAEDVTLALRVIHEDGQALIEGLLTSAGDPLPEAAPVRLYAAAAPDQPVASETADGPLFTLGPIPPGHYTLEVELPAIVIAVEDLSL